jgi:predicted lactoylglutathione lyase
MREIFVNLPVKDLKASVGFFTGLGFQYNPQFSDDTGASMIIEENIHLMLITDQRFEGLIDGQIADATKTTEAIHSLSAASNEDVDQMVAKALASGGTAWKPTSDEGPMHVGSFRDPDDHPWEILHVDQGAWSGGGGAPADPGGTPAT